MNWWEVILDKMNVGDGLLTPGRGIEGARKKPFEILSKSQDKIVILSGRFLITLEKECFETVEEEFSKNPLLWLRVASLHGNEPFENSVDKLIRERTGSKLARGNYICAILEHCGLARYEMRGNRRGIEVTPG
jgi:hypothetical protein